MRSSKYVFIAILCFTGSLGVLNAQWLWSDPLSDEKERVIQNVVKSISVKWWDYKKKILSQLRGMENKIDPAKKIILDRLIYLVDDNNNITVTAPNKKKNRPKNSLLTSSGELNTSLNNGGSITTWDDPDVINKTPVKYKNGGNQGISTYSRDDKFVYSNGNEIPFADPDTFQVFKDDNYAIDKNRMYIAGHAMEKGRCFIEACTREYASDKIKPVDKKTFRYISNWLGKDKNYVYWSDIIVIGADPATFQKIENSAFYFKDKNNVYYQFEKIIGADPATFIALNYLFYGKDKDGAFFFWKKIEWADAGTFKALTEDYAKDANHYYKRGVVTVAP